MGEAHERPARKTIERIIGAAFGAAMVVFGAFWIALPFVIREGLGPGSKMERDFLTPVFCIELLPGLLFIGVGLILIWWNR